MICIVTKMCIFLFNLSESNMVISIFILCSFWEVISCISFYNLVVFEDLFKKNPNFEYLLLFKKFLAKNIFNRDFCLRESAFSVQIFLTRDKKIKKCTFFLYFYT